MLAYLYTSTVSFTQLPSEYLVKDQEVFSLDDSQDDSIVFLLPSPREWLLDNFKALQGQRDPIEINPCCPRAMYRLADCYEMTVLREMAKSRILTSLTIENVSKAPLPLETVAPLKIPLALYRQRTNYSVL